MGRICRIRLLGGFGVTVDEDVVSSDAWRSRRAADLVKLLALEPIHRLHREQVMEALWPDLDANAAAANLRKAVHFARRALGDAGAVTTEAGLVSLWPEASIEVDLLAFEERAGDALASSDPAMCREVAAGITADLLPADRYEPWVREPQAKLKARLIELLKRGGEYERVLELEPADESAYRALMRRHIDAGDRSAAIREFGRLRDVLREHMGVGPDKETVALYEDVLAMEGDEPPTPREKAAALLANGLVAWGRRDLDEAERLAEQARALALDARLGHELGEASTLLGLIAYARGTWHEVFRQAFADSVGREPDLEMAVYDAHLCFQEFYLYGPDGHEGADAFARELLALAEQAGSASGRALATLLLGEFSLLSGNLDEAASTLGEAASRASASGCVSGQSIALERLAETEVARGNLDAARTAIVLARPLAETSWIPSHLIIRVFGVELAAAEQVVDALRVVGEAERWMADAPRVCEPCSMTFRVGAARVAARAGDLGRARRHLAEAERITGLWQDGPWTAAIWEARAEIRRAEGQVAQANALFEEAAQRFADLRRPLDEARCRANIAVAV